MVMQHTQGKFLESLSDFQNLLLAVFLTGALLQAEI